GVGDANRLVFEVLHTERRGAEVAEGDRIFERAIADAAGGEVAELRRVDQRVTACLHAHAAGAVSLAVDVQPLVRPLPRQPLAGAELDVNLVALRVAVLVQERLAVLAERAVILLHGGEPAVRPGRPHALRVVPRAATQQLRAAFPA